MTRTLFTNARIATMTEPEGLGIIEDGALLVEGDSIAWLGPAGEAPESDRTVDCGGRLMTPGLIDCHTHLIHAGSRAKEFEMRLEGASYAEIARAGGGIVSTVKATREASEEELIAGGARRLACLLAEGVTTVEIKSGYGLDVETELRMLRAARALGRGHPVDVVTSYLGAHALPPEYREDRAGYLRLVCEHALPAVAAEGLADAVDAFCETIAFTVEEVEQVFARAGELGLPVKLHAEQLSNLGGAAMAARHGAIVGGSSGISRRGRRAGDRFGRHGRGAAARRLLLSARDASAAGRRPEGARRADRGRDRSQPRLVARAFAARRHEHGLRAVPVDARRGLRGVTANAARALGLSDRGRLEPGLRADLVLWDADGPADLVHSLGLNACAAVIRKGEIVRGNLGDEP
jgi:imidazolonepropionase